MSEKGKRYPRIVQLQRVELSGRVAVEFLPSGSWKFEEARGDVNAVEGISMVFGEDEVAALIALVRGLRDEPGELAGAEPPRHELVGGGAVLNAATKGWSVLCGCGWRDDEHWSSAQAEEAYLRHEERWSRAEGEDEC